MEKEIRKILYENLGYGNADKAVNELLVLFGVSQQRELYCFECEIEMPTKVDNKSVLRCGNCGLKH